MKKLVFTILLLQSIVIFGQSIITEPFNKEKWLISSEYRYDLILRSYKIIAPHIEFCTEDELTSLLGNPIERRIRTNSPVLSKDGWITANEVVDLTYCLDIEDKPLNELENRPLCQGTMITFHFYKNEKVDATIAIAD